VGKPTCPICAILEDNVVIGSRGLSHMSVQFLWAMQGRQDGHILCSFGDQCSPGPQLKSFFQLTNGRLDG